MRKRKGGKFSENKYCWYAGEKKKAQEPWFI